MPYKFSEQCQAISFKIQFNLLKYVSVQTTATALPQINIGIHIATLPELYFFLCCPVAKCVIMLTNLKLYENNWNIKNMCAIREEHKCK